MIARFRRTFVAGLVVVLPVLVTIYLLGLLFGTLEELGLASHIEALAGRRIPGLGTLIFLSFIVLVGLLADNFVGVRVVRAVDAALLRVPLVRSIFGPAKQFVLSLGSEQEGDREVVAIEYPRRGLYMVGFVTRREPHSVCVFIPTSPNPTSGFLMECAPGEVRPLGLSFEAAMRFVVSGGMVDPGVSLLPGPASAEEGPAA